MIGTRGFQLFKNTKRNDISTPHSSLHGRLSQLVSCGYISDSPPISRCKHPNHQLLTTTPSLQSPCLDRLLPSQHVEATASKLSYNLTIPKAPTSISICLSPARLQRTSVPHPTRLWTPSRVTNTRRSFYSCVMFMVLISQTTSL